MMGWHISVYRQKGGGDWPATPTSLEGERLAVWQGGWNGLDWIDELVKAGQAIDLGGNGYPSYYTATAGTLIPLVIEKTPPDARATWAHGPNDILTEKWAGKTVTDPAAAARCHPEEWLLVRVWDES
jgi:hypothetical protein